MRIASLHITLILALVLPLGFVHNVESKPVSTTCASANPVLDGVMFSICMTGDSSLVGSQALQSVNDSNFADVIIESPFNSHMRFYVIKNGVVPQQFDPTNLSTAQTPSDVLTDLERQFSVLGVNRVATPTLSANNTPITGVSFLRPIVSSLFSYWAMSLNGNMLIIEIEEPVAVNEPVNNTTEKYSSLSVSTPSVTFLFLPMVASNFSATSQTGISNEQLAPTDNLPFPSWWNGECNVNNHPGSYSRGTYRGVHACAPNGQAQLVRFFPGAWGELEWQCVEFVMRYMYLAYGTHPYGANGNQVYTNYSGQTGIGLRKIPNNTRGEYPQTGDVISFDGGAYGHTAIVIESSVDNNGNGYYKTINQNYYSSTPIATYNVRNWNAQAIGWLRDPRTTPESLLQFYLSGSSAWQVFNLSNSLVNVSGDPIVYSHDDGSISLFVRDTNNHLQQFYKSPTAAWQAFDLSSGLVTIAGDPTLYIHSDGSISLFVRDTNNHLQQFYKSPTAAWQAFDLSNGLVAIAGDPSLYIHNDGSISLFVRDVRNHLEQFYKAPNAGWQAFDLSIGLVMIAGDPAVYSHPQNTAVSLFVRDTNNHLRQFYKDSSPTWQAFDLSNGLVTIAGDPAVYSHPQNTAVSLFVRDTSNHLRQFYKDTSPTWQAFDLSNGLVTIAGDPAVYSHPQNTAVSLFVRDTNNHLRQFYKDTSPTWQAFDLSPSNVIYGQDVAVFDDNLSVSVFTR